MKRNKIFLLVLLLLISSISLAQEKLIHGQILNKVEVEGIHILNADSRYNSITDESGKFSIKVKINDTLVISSVNYYPTKKVITAEVFDNGTISIILKELINELDEVVIGRTLTGNINTDLKNIKTEKPINFDDVGIPGFKGKPEEKIVPIVPSLGLLTAVDLEAMYKHLSGYYKKLRIRRKWEAQNISVVQMINYYPPGFFDEAYGIPTDRLYDFMLFCLETTSIQSDFNTENFAGVLSSFQESAIVYRSRLEEIKE